jgi:hypothetical protein
MRLEILTCADRYAPTAWLGLSQLHTLRGVDLTQVTVASIAAGLPRLHTLDVFTPDNSVPRDFFFSGAAVNGFFDLLLPRLRAFQFHGRWPRVDEEMTLTPQPLPRLEQLSWWERSNRHPVTALFFGAQPASLRMRVDALDDLFAAIDSAADSAGVPTIVGTFWARLREVSVDLSRLAPGDVARVLRAAPQLRQFTAEVQQREEPFWLASAEVTDPALTGLTHTRLRHLVVNAVTASRKSSLAGVDCAVSLRRRHFPQLQQLVLDRKDFFVTPIE